MSRLAAGLSDDDRDLVNADGLPLDGVTVLDFSQFLAGPACALRLADLGARVIKVERPNGGDACRQLKLADGMFDQDSALFHVINRNKQSYAADLKSPADLARVRKLIAGADVLIQNFRPGIMDRLGLGWSDLSVLNPRLIYASVSGYGPDGPWRDKPGQDLLIQSLSGIAWLTGNAGDAPVPAGLAVADMAAGNQLAQAILALLVRRGVTGRGGRADVSLMEAAIDLQFEPLGVFLNGAGAAPERSAASGANVYLPAPYGIYATADSYIALAMMPLAQLAAVIGCEALAADPDESFAARDRVKAVIAAHLATASRAHWLERLEPAGLWAAPVLSWPELTRHPGFVALKPTQVVRSPAGTELVTTRCPIRIDGRILTSDRPAPRLGADTGAIDAELQMAEIAA